MNIKRRIAAVATTGMLALTATLVTPAIASATPECTTAAEVTTCKGKTSDGAAYEFRAPSAGVTSGIFFLYSHGYRANFSLPAALGGPLNLTPVIAPDASVATAMLTSGYGLGGSGFTEQGWNIGAAVKSNVELIGIVKAKFPSIKKVVVWGTSRGGTISQALAEAYPNLVDAVGPMCAVADNVAPILEQGTHIVYALKALFDPSIKGFNYTPGPAGIGEAAADIAKVAALLPKLQASLATNAWPDTAPAPLRASGIPPRSALLLTGLIADIPTRSRHFDGATGPGDPASLPYYQFAVAVQPALAVLENLADNAGLLFLGRLDAEVRAGGNVADNTAADYNELLGDNRDVFNTALSGDVAIDVLLGVLKATPRVTGNAAAIAKWNSTVTRTTGKVSDPTILMHTTVDALVHPGHQQWYINKYKKQYAAAVAKAKKAAKAKAAKLGKTVKPVLPRKMQMALWTEPPASYTKFLPTGTPDTSFAAPFGAGHCNFSGPQLATYAQLLAIAAQEGKLPKIAFRDLIFGDGSGFIDDESYEFELPTSLRK